MDLKIFRREERWGYLGGRDLPTVSINRKKSRLCFNTCLAETLDLRAGDRVVLGQDTDSRGDWYISFSHGETEDGYLLSQVPPRTGSNKGLMSNCHKEASEGILNLVEAPNSATLIVGTSEPKSFGDRLWYRVLTRNPIRVR